MVKAGSPNWTQEIWGINQTEQSNNSLPADDILNMSHYLSSFLFSTLSHSELVWYNWSHLPFIIILPSHTHADTHISTVIDVYLCCSLVQFMKTWMCVCVCAWAAQIHQLHVEFWYIFKKKKKRHINIVYVTLDISGCLLVTMATAKLFKNTEINAQISEWNENGFNVTSSTF